MTDVQKDTTLDQVKDVIADDMNAWMYYSQAIAATMSNRMEELGMTQRALAEKMNCTQQYVSKVLKGRENLSLETLCKIENALDIKIKTENKRFDQNEIFMSKKQQIIENAFRQLALDRKALECERLNLEYEKGKFAKQKLHSRANSDSMGAGTFENNYCGSCVFFRGVDNELALRKRYKELLKIFHPDNRCGDTKTLLLIQKEYEKMKRQYYEV